jgi:N-acetylglucosaminyl-diphospho-decaprenol L-rhamnosyltransferase
VKSVDVVLVSFNSRDRLRAAVAPLAALSDAHVFVVDNASVDGSLDVLDGLDLTTIALTHNGGFAHGSNVGIREGTSPFVLLLNPDATIDETSLRRLVRVAEENGQVGAVAPRILESDGSLDFSLRRFPRLRSTFARALFLQRLFPRAGWTDEVIRDPEAYTQARTAEWVSGACVLLRREALERIGGGLDESFFLYSEDIDLCRRLWQAGYEVRYEPEAVARHEGGASAPRPVLLPMLAESRVLYARKHHGRLVELLERIGLGLDALTHAAVGRGGRAARAGHLRTLRRVAGRLAPHGPSRTAR